MDPMSMTREQLLQALADLGFNVAVITDATSDDALREIWKAVADEADAAPDAAAAPGDMPDDAFGEMGLDDPDKPDAMPPGGSDGVAEPPAEPADGTHGNTDPGVAMGDNGLVTRDAEDEPDMMPVKKMGQGQPTRKYGEGAGKANGKPAAPATARTVNRIERRLDALDRQTARRLAREKHANIQAFCERLRAEGRLPPALADPLVPFMMTLDAGRVRKFSEGGPGRTQLDEFMSILDQSPTYISFAERVKQPAGGGGKDPEVARVEQHYQKFSERYAKVGTTKEKLVKAFNYERKQNPHLTADEFVSLNR